MVAVIHGSYCPTSCADMARSTRGSAVIGPGPMRSRGGGSICGADARGASDATIGHGTGRLFRGRVARSGSLQAGGAVDERQVAAGSAEKRDPERGTVYLGERGADGGYPGEAREARQPEGLRPGALGGGGPPPPPR